MKTFLKKKKKKSDNIVVNFTKISQKMKKINWLNIEKILWNEKKHFIVTIRNNYLKKKMI